MGADGKLADWAAITKYFETVAAASPRVEMVDVGPTTEGRRIIGAIISSAENIRNLSTLQIDNRLLADPRRLANDREVRAIMTGAKAVVAIGCSIHASEIGATQSANDLLYELATADDERTVADAGPARGRSSSRRSTRTATSLVTDWHRKMQGTPFDGRPDAVVVPTSTSATTSTATPSC